MEITAYFTGKKEREEHVFRHMFFSLFFYEGKGNDVFYEWIISLKTI